MAKKTPTCKVSSQGLRVNQPADFLLFFTLEEVVLTDGLTPPARPFTAVFSETIDSAAVFRRLTNTLTQYWMVFLGTIRGVREIVTRSRAAAATQVCVRANSRPLISHRVGLCDSGFISTSAAGSCQPDECCFFHNVVFSLLFLVVRGRSLLAPYRHADNNSRTAFSAVNRSVLREKHLPLDSLSLCPCVLFGLGFFFLQFSSPRKFQCEKSATAN